ncbi:tyrosine-type recombinase/integrase [Nocardia carnea]|uniref:tyrosine-type recombinase/integrase n=1 Tax=Nocardia carnea TaxID=37328 RepID=UPI0024565389|nr:tyrosine-type recombinase/integrase [Nocardia carnea]
MTQLTNAGMAPSTVAKVYYLFSKSMKQAALAKVVPVNPCKGIELPPIPPGPDRYLTDEEVSAIQASLDDFDLLIVDVLLGAGLRLGEALGLHWEHVDLKRREVTVAWSYDPVEHEMKAPKDYERRTVPIGKGLTDRLRSHLATVSGLGRPAPEPVTYPKNARLHSGLVLAHVNGRPFDPSNFRHRWEASVRIAYVGKGRNRHQIGQVRLHDLRHTYASRLLEKNVPIEDVSRLLGHASVTTTMRYSHLRKSGWDAVRAALG